jgi:hypothetical protein
MRYYWFYDGDRILIGSLCGSTSHSTLFFIIINVPMLKTSQIPICLNFLICHLKCLLG